MENLQNTYGRVTVPTDVDILDDTLRVMKQWGADAVRDCDGTKLPDEVKAIAEKVYTTYFLTRGDQEWAKAHPEELQQIYLMSNFCTAVEETLEILLLDGYFDQQVALDTRHDPQVWWEVIDRTTGEVVPPEQWTFSPECGTVTVAPAVPFHEYTVSFLVYAIWDPTQMYNHITNNWGDKPHEMPYDARLPATQAHMLELLESWLDENPDTDVVRFTTFFYHFTLVFNTLAKEKFVDWFGYSASVSPLALEQFAAEKGYRLRPEDIVDQGYYNSAFRVPSPAYKDFLDFQSHYVAKLAKQCVDKAHAHGKEAMMFLGDNWIGTEPYGPYFADIGMEAVVGSVGSGATLRLISEIPGVKYTEGRFLPYFFPDVFNEQGDPIGEARDNWMTARRAILRKPVDRIGYGGYLKLAVQAPGFVEYIEQVCNEFRTLYDHIGGSKPYVAPFKVAVLNCWGKLRSWSTHMVAHALWYKQIYSYLGALEALSGMAVDVEFISFDDVRANPAMLDAFGVILNAGDADTAFSGGENWADETIVTAIRRFVYNGGGFVGIGEPSATQKDGKYFQLSSILGVEKERGFSLSTRKYNHAQHTHFITEDVECPPDFGEGMKNVYALDGAQVLISQNSDVQLAVNTYGKGRGVYISGLPYNPVNTRLLLRSLCWVASQEKALHRWFSSNIYTECHCYPDSRRYAVVNNDTLRQETTVYTDQNCVTLSLEPGEIRWFTV